MATHRLDKRNECVPGGRNWVPWVGLAMVAPAVVVIALAAFGFLLTTDAVSPETAAGADSPGISGIAVGLVAIVCSFIALAIGFTGVMRVKRRPSAGDGRSIGATGAFMEIAVVVVALLALIILVAMAAF
jgi:uncharacterized membrane protein YidH (DUF202 family)